MSIQTKGLLMSNLKNNLKNDALKNLEIFFNSSDNKAFHELNLLTKEEWINEIVNYIYSTVNGVKKNDVLNYIESTFNIIGAFDQKYFFKGFYGFSFDFFDDAMNDISKKMIENQSDAIIVLKMVSKYNTFNSNINKNAISINNVFNDSLNKKINTISNKKSDYSDFSVKYVQEYQNEEDEDKCISINNLFPKFKGINTQPITGMGISDYYNPCNIYRDYNEGLDQIFRPVTQAALAWFYTQGFFKMHEHVKNSINQNFSKEELSSIFEG
jgi:hypothetical protein